MISGPKRFRLHRPVDLLAAVVGLALTSPVLVAAWLAAGFTAKGSGIFRQTRIGRGAEPFAIMKFRSMHATSSGTSVTTAGDSRITSVGRILRRTKVDEIPQLVNVLLGEMALVGPRPDVAGFADALVGADRNVLTVRPGITGPASLLFSDEETMLASVEDADAFNADVLYPLKTAINLAWISHGTLLDDLRILVWTVKSPAAGALEDLIHTWEPGLEIEPLHNNKQAGS